MVIVLLCAFVLSLGSFVARIPTALAYETDTHKRITDTAVDESVVSKGYLEQELGLTLETGLSSNGERFRIADWPGQGSIREDDFNLGSFAPFRFRNHFYDPIFDRGLTGNLNGAASVGRRAFEWALEDADTITGQDFSWRDGRAYFLSGLMAPTPAKREESMGPSGR